MAWVTSLTVHGSNNATARTGSIPSGHCLGPVLLLASIDKGQRQEGAGRNGMGRMPDAHSRCCFPIPPTVRAVAHGVGEPDLPQYTFGRLSIVGLMSRTLRCSACSTATAAPSDSCGAPWRVPAERCCNGILIL